jgi:hypothetical protein
MSPNAFLFSDEPDAGKAKVVRIPSGLTEKVALIEAFRVGLSPPYLSDHWDSLFDILRDLSWVDQKLVQIRHADLPLVGHFREQRTYLELLANAVTDWTKGESHQLEVVFPRELAAEVSLILDAV